MTDELKILSEYIRKEMDYDGVLEPDQDLLDERILDSFSIVQMAVFIEETFNVELEPEDLVRTNLATLSSMVALIDKRRAANE